MAIYRQGQASMDAQGYVTGYDTKWREQLTLIRPGATIFFLTQPLQAAVITEVISDTSIRAITTGGAVVQKTNYLILLHDSLTVDGLAQDVAETLRYYQSKETEIADALEFFRDFDLDGLKDLVNQVKQGAESAKQSASAASLEIDRPSGKYFKMLNDGNSSHPATFKLWGNGSDRASVIEWGFDNGPGWVFYAQLNSNNSRQLQVNGPVNATAFNQGSDRDLKTDIKPIENARLGLEKVSGYTYTLKKDGMPYAGVIAQEIMEVVPEAISSFEDYQQLHGPTKDGSELIGKERFLQVDYSAVTAYILQVCKEQEEELRSLRSEVDELKSMVAKLVDLK